MSPPALLHRLALGVPIALLAALDRRTERTTVPAHGTQVRIFASRLDVVRAGLDPQAPLVVEVIADTAGVLHLAGLGDAGRDLTYGPGTQRFTVASSG